MSPVSLLLVAALAQAGSAPAGSLTLREAIDDALRHSPRLLPSEDAAARADIERRIALARYSPKIAPDVSTGAAPAALAHHGAGVTVTQLLPTGTEVRGNLSAITYGAGSTAFRDAGYQFGFSQPLTRGLGAVNRADLQGAAEAAAAAQRDTLDARQQLVVETAQAYFAVARQQRLVEEAERATGRAATLVEMSEARANVGLSTQLDVLRAGILNTQARASVLRARDALDAAREDLNVLLGRPANTPLRVAGDLHDDTATLGIDGTAIAAIADPDAVLIRALADRADARTARDRVVSARRAVDVERWNELPRVDLNVDYARRGLAGGVASTLAAATNGWRVGVSTTYSLDRAGRSASAGLAQIALRAAERDAADVEQRIAVDVRRASRAAATASESVALARSSAELAEKQRELAVYRFERGLADNLDVVDAENTIFQAQSALIGAEIDRTLALVRVQRSSGALDPNRFLR